MAVPSLASLEALEAIARAGSVTRAARALHLTQSAISHRVRGLERDTGLRLLEHVGRGVRLTAAGLRLARAATEARQLLEDTVASLTREPGREVLSISCSPSFAIRFLVPRLAKFHAAHPELDLRVAADESAFDPLHGSADALVRLSAGPAPGTFSEKLGDEVVFPVVSPRLLERGRALDKPADLSRHTLLHDEALAEAPERVGWSSWLAHAGVPLLRARAIRFSHAYLAIEAALAGDGVALARRSLVAEDLARGRLVAPLEPSVPSGLSYFWITAQDPSRRASLAALRRFLRDGLRDAGRLADRARKRRRTRR
ncbi:MAG TPA: LysR substrate-binding domain-containing protein [Polyangiales bacterium]|nr:LysR substrate-binding domain-containing protein [Polyangiales bacterium]